MAGVAEATAILTVAQVGFSLALKLKDFLGDYKSVADLIKGLCEELDTTSSSLQNLGELAKENGLHNPKGVSDTKKLTERCQRTFSDIKVLLKLESLPDDSFSSSAEAELTRLERLKWAFSKSKLDVPRANLSRLKLDMMLLYFTLMTFKAYD
jgi:hypothetical protein